MKIVKISTTILVVGLLIFITLITFKGNHTSEIGEPLPIVADGINFEQVETSYSHTPNSFVESAGKIYYISFHKTEEKKPNKSAISVDGKTVSDLYDSISELQIIDGKVAAIVKDGFDKFIYYDGKEIGREGGALFSKEVEVASVNNKLAYRINKHVYYDEIEIGTQYQNQDTSIDFPPKIISGKLAYSINKQGKKYIIYDNTQFGQNYGDVNGPYEVNGKFLFYAKKGNLPLDPWVMVINGTEIELAGTKQNYLSVKDGKVFYSFFDEGKTMIMYGEKIYGNKFDSISPAYAEVLNSDLAYHAKKDNLQYVVFKDKSYQLESSPSLPSFFSIISGKITFEQRDTKGNRWIYYDGIKQEFSAFNEYSTDKPFFELHNQLTFIAQADEQGTVLVYGDKIIPLDYDYVSKPELIVGKLIFGAMKDNIVYIVREI